MSTPTPTPSRFVVGTRKSNLALIQTQWVADALAAANSPATFPVEHMTTLGDRNQTTPLHELSPFNSAQPAKSLWTDELESALLDGRFDLLVHSCKDVPTAIRDGCEFAALLERHDPRDAFVVKQGLPYKSLDELPAGSVIGTGSVRRVAQLSRAYPKLKFADMRGNLNTRLGKLDAPDSPFAALILAISGMVRLGAGDRLTAPLEYPVLMHAVGQGALAVEIRQGDVKTREALRKVSHWQTEWRVGAERGLLRELEGGCSVPVGVETTLTELPADDATPAHYPADTFPAPTSASPTLHFSGILPTTTPLPVDGETPALQTRRVKLDLKACVTSTDGSRHVLYEPGPAVITSWREAERWGEECARQLRTLGASEILEVIETDRKAREASALAKAAVLQAQSA
ncbi:Porphobilinogen deaminase [Vanrija pseudolonga]|uniref:Porphobilinogen deaminase n=1 Tax=Vanrija pseudolonga TaxID=143232 RepID=A0AAF0Y1X0_9TREE|nr:Porphobilinogen deaminase [Vanrija pseudolonga]